MFQLVPKQWYAMEIFGASGAPTNPHVSPIYLRAIKPMKTGQGLLKLKFYHANYPEGVRDKEYDLRVIHRAPSHLAGLRADDAQVMVVLFTLEKAWLETHFPHFDRTWIPN